jgi:hypothetical protein
MNKTYVTFGQNHAHRVNGKTFDCDSVAVIESEDEESGRAETVELFGDKFCTTYYEDQWDEPNRLHYFPRGYINI